MSGPLVWDHQPALKFVEFVTLGNIRDSLKFMHGLFETKTKDRLVVIKEEKWLVAIKKEDDSEIGYGSDHIKREGKLIREEMAWRIWILMWMMAPSS